MTTLFPHLSPTCLMAPFQPVPGSYVDFINNFPDNVGGHSMQAGGATALAEARLPPNIIQAIGR